MKKITNKLLVSAITMLVLVGVIATNFTSCKKKEPETIKIGAILPLTGPAAFIGEWHREGLEFAKEELKRTLGTEIEIIYEDSKNDPKTGLSAFRNLKFKNVSACISAMSAVTLPLIPLIDKEKIPLFVTSVSYPNIAEKSKFLYRYNITVDLEAKEISEYLLTNLHETECNLFYINDEYGLAARDVFRDNFEKKQGKIVFEASFEKDATDFRGIILKSKKEVPYFIAGYGKAYTILMKQIIEIVKKPKIITVYSMDIPEFIQPLIGTGIEVFYTRVKRDDSILAEFESKFEKKYNRKPNMVNILCYDLLYIITQLRKYSSTWNIDEIRNKRTEIKLRSAYGYEIEILPSGEIKVPVEISKKKL